MNQDLHNIHISSQKGSVGGELVHETDYCTQNKMFYLHQCKRDEQDKMVLLALMSTQYQTDGSGTGFLVPCLQTDSCNRNTQLPKYPRGKQDTLRRDITFWRIQNIL